MKRDWDVVRQVLLEIEERNDGSLFCSDSTDPIKTRHAFLLRDGGYISAIDASTLSGRALIQPELTWAGHDLLDTIRSRTVWDRIKQLAKDKGIELTFDAVKLLAGKALELAVAG